MADSSSEKDIFDVGKIRRLVELMEDHDLTEVDLRQGETRIQLRRGREPAVAGGAAPSNPAPVAAPPVQETPGAASEPALDREHLTAIKSPMVGTFYAAADPDSPPYVKVGDHVGPETTICIVEAMKILNHIPAEVSGRIVSVLVENGDPVEFGQRMFEVDARG